ncbi:Uncharacterised protein [Cedecea neteri]|uniref:Uncharacterized protein n=1 Tax=Cedecea neteri TaxID=158822 RepID=A0A2X3JC55_9ENTR|nr:Uncharacterised protein [Cedecea neteri]
MNKCDFSNVYVDFIGLSFTMAEFIYRTQS